MAYDAHANLAYTLLTNSPGTAGTTFNVTAGTGAYFPAAPFNCTVWPSGVIPTQGNGEIVRVTNVTGDALTVTRAKEGSAAINAAAGYQFMLSITVADIVAIETQSAIAGSAPASAQIAVGTSGSVYAPVTLSGDATITGAGVVTVTSSNGSAFGSGAFAAAYSLPTASTTVLGGVKVDGTTVTITGGVISSTGGASGANPTATIGLTAVNGSAATFLRSDGAPALGVGIAPTWTGIHTFNQTGLGNNATGNAVLMENIQTASSGNQQYSPALNWTGQGWKTNSTAASQSVAFQAYVVPVQGAAAPTGLWTLNSSVNGGAFGNALTYDTAGNMIIPSSLSVGGTAYTYGAPSTTGATAYLVPATIYTVTGSATTANFQANYFGIPTFTNASAGAITDLFNTLIAGPPVIAGSLTNTRLHSLGILDSTSASGASTQGAFVVANTLGTAATSVSIGAGYVNAGTGVVVGNTSITSGSINGTSGNMTFRSNAAVAILQGNTLQFSPANGQININTLGTLQLAQSNVLAASWLTSGIIMAAAGYTATNTSATGTYATATFSSFAQPTLAASNASTITTDAATIYIAGAPIQGTNQTITRGHSLLIVDSTSAASAITGGIVISTTLGTAATSVGIGGGNINLGGSITTGAGVTNAAGTWKLGALRTGTALVISTTQGIQIDVGGTLYTLAVLSTNP